MKILPIANNNNKNSYANKQSFRACSSAACVSDTKRISEFPITEKYAIYDFESPEKRKARREIYKDLSEIEEEQLSFETCTRYACQLEDMKRSIIKDCIEFDDYKEENFSYDNALSHYADWQEYAIDEDKHLSGIMNVPYVIAGEEITIARYIEEHPNDPINELLDSTIFKMYFLLKFNKQARTHFHG